MTQDSAQNAAELALADAHAEIARLRKALRFYANGDHYHLDEDESFDSVSGEPTNWLFSGMDDSTTSIEDGSIARYALQEQAIDWTEGGEGDEPRPIEGEVSCASPEVIGLGNPSANARLTTETHSA